VDLVERETAHVKFFCIFWVLGVKVDDVIKSEEVGVVGRECAVFACVLKSHFCSVCKHKCFFWIVV